MLAQSKPLSTLSISFSTSPYSSGHLHILINYYTVALTTVTSFSHQYSSLFNSWDKLLTIVNKRNELEFEWNHFLHVRLKVSKDSSVKSHLFFFFFFYRKFYYNVKPLQAEKVFMNTLPMRIACWGFSKCSMSGCRWHYTRLWLKAKLCHESLLAMQAEQAAVGGIFFRRR